MNLRSFLQKLGLPVYGHRSLTIRAQTAGRHRVLLLQKGESTMAILHDAVVRNRLLAALSPDDLAQLEP